MGESCSFTQNAHKSAVLNSNERLIYNRRNRLTDPFLQVEDEKAEGCHSISDNSQATIHDSPCEIDPTMFGDSPDIDVDGPQPSPNPWHPFLSRLHCQLVLLYHGSHRKNIDLVTFRAFLSVLRVWVPPDVYFPSVEEIINFTSPFWEEKLL